VLLRHYIYLTNYKTYVYVSMISVIATSLTDELHGTETFLKS